MSEQHDADCEDSKAELVDLEDLACPANRAALVTDAELSRDDEDVVILLALCQRLEHLLRLGRLLQVVRTELVAVIVVVEPPLRRDHSENLFDRFAVGRGDRLPLRDGEPSLGVRRQRLLLGDLLVGETDAGKELSQDDGLLRDALDLVVLGIHAARLHLFVHELVSHCVISFWIS